MKKLIFPIIVATVFFTAATSDLSANEVGSREGRITVSDTIADAKHYSLKHRSCAVSLETHAPNSINASVIQFRRACDNEYAQEMSFVALLLAKAHEDGVLDDINTIAWGAIDGENRRRLATSAAKSKLWSSYEGSISSKNMPILVDLLRDHSVFQELIAICSALGYDAQVVGVEGAIVDNLSKIQNIAPGEEDIVVPHSGIVWFSLAMMVE